MSLEVMCVHADLCVCVRECVYSWRNRVFFNDTSRCSHDEWGREGMRERGAEEEYKKGYFREHYEEEENQDWAGEMRRRKEKQKNRSTEKKWKETKNKFLFCPNSNLSGEHWGNQENFFNSSCKWYSACVCVCNALTIIKQY